MPAREVTVTYLNKLIYVVGSLITEQRTSNEEKRKQRNRDPPWKYRIQNKIEEMRKDLSLLIETEKNTEQRLYNKYEISNTEKFKTIIEMLKQKIQAQAQKI